MKRGVFFMCSRVLGHELIQNTHLKQIALKISLVTRILLQKPFRTGSGIDGTLRNGEQPFVDIGVRFVRPAILVCSEADLVATPEALPVELEATLAVEHVEIYGSQRCRGLIRARGSRGANGIDIGQGTRNITAAQFGLGPHQVYFAQAHQYEVDTAKVVSIIGSSTELVL